MQITLTNNNTGEYKTAPIGFSWTTFFFGCFPALFRADWKWAGIQFILAWFTAGISWLVMPFIYNKLHIKDLINKGFYPTSEHEEKILMGKGILTKQELEFFKNR